jgi:hypothetical protein
MSLSCIAHVKRNLNNNDDNNRPPAPPIASFMGSTWDRSGSMQDMNGTPGPALYDWVKDACDQARILNQDCYLSVTTFDDRIEKKIDNVHWKNINISLNQAKEWTEPRGMTKLYDTAVADIHRLRKNASAYRLSLPAAVRALNPRIVIAWSLMTDGMDNESNICFQSTLAETVRDAKANGCHCYFLAANCDGEQRGMDYGFDQENSLTFTADRECSDNAFRGISEQLRNATSGSQRTAIPQTLRQSSCPAPSHSNTRISNTVLIPQNTLSTNHSLRARIGRSLRTVAPSSFAQQNLSPPANSAPGLIFGSRRAYYNSLNQPTNSRL